MVLGPGPSRLGRCCMQGLRVVTILALLSAVSFAAACTQLDESRAASSAADASTSDEGGAGAAGGGAAVGGGGDASSGEALANGVACTTDEECASRTCRDQVCCEADCAGA